MPQCNQEKLRVSGRCSHYFSKPQQNSHFLQVPYVSQEAQNRGRIFSRLLQNTEELSLTFSKLQPIRDSGIESVHCWTSCLPQGQWHIPLSGVADTSKYLWVQLENIVPCLQNTPSTLLKWLDAQADKHYKPVTLQNCAIKFDKTLRLTIPNKNKAASCGTLQMNAYCGLRFHRLDPLHQMHELSSSVCKCI